MRTIIGTIMILLVSVTLGSCGMTGTGKQAADQAITHDATDTVEEWKSAYQDYLNKIYKSYKNPDKRLWYFCKDVDQNEIPELFVFDYDSLDSDEMMKAYTYQKKAVVEIGSRCITGTTMLLYSEDSACPGIFTFDVGGGLDRYGYITVQNGKLSETDLWTETIEEEGGRKNEISSDKRLIRESKKVYREERRITEFKVKPDNVLRQEPIYDPANIKTLRIDQAEQKTRKKGKAETLNVKADAPCVQSNNNRMNGSFVLPYEDGYFYDAEEGEEHTDSTVVYQDGEGNTTAQEEEMGLTCDLYEDHGFVYFYDDDKKELRRRKDGKTETIIEFFYTSEYEKPVFFAEDAIYYTDITDHAETYVCKVDYEGGEKQELYKIDVWIEQIYKYGNDLWFLYRDPLDGIDDRKCLGKIDLTDESMTVYEGVHPDNPNREERLVFNNGYVYFNEKGLKRIRIGEECIEQVTEKNADAVNFVDESLLFYRDKTLYRMDSDSVKPIKTLKGSTDGFYGIRVEDSDIYIGTYSGGLYSAISQIDKDGKTLKNIK